MSNVIKTAKFAKEAALKLANLDSSIKNEAIRVMAEMLWSHKDDVLSANKHDVEEFTDKIPKALLKRLELNETKLRVMMNQLLDVAKLDDPVGKTLSALELDEGLELYQVTSPIGVIGAVFEARPDAATQIASLCFKAGNACILKGGSEANRTNKVLVTLMQEAVESKTGIKNAIELIETREDVKEMLKLDEYIDLLVPRGSNKFVKFIMQNTNIPVLGHSDGICHEYVDKNADVGKAVRICLDAKVQYAAVCNAVETILVHENIAKVFLPKLAEKFDDLVEMRCDIESGKILNRVKLAKEEDWSTEYNDLIVSIKIVSSLQEAIDHVNKYGSKHTDGIITEDKDAAAKFLKEVDTANAFWNCSTRFSDGFRYGKGAELGISTNKIHARGPVGLEGLVIYKYIMKGDGQTVGEYSDKQFTHKKLDKEFSV